MNTSLPTGSPMPSSHFSQLNTSPALIKATRKSPETKYFGDFGYRVINQPSFMDSPKTIPEDINQKLGIISINGVPIDKFNKKDNEPSIMTPNKNEENEENDFIENNDDNKDDYEFKFEENDADEDQNNVIADQLIFQETPHSSDAEDVIQLDDYNVFTPRPNKQQSNIISTPSSDNKVQATSKIPIIETIGSKYNIQSVKFSRIVKKAAVSSLGKLTGQQQTRIFCSKVYANFFQVFDEWNRQRELEEEKKQTEKQKETRPVNQSLPIQLQLAKEKIKLLSNEEKLWKDESQKNQFTFEKANDDNDDSLQPLKVDVNYDYDLTKKIVTQTDLIHQRIQSDYSQIDLINSMAEELSVKWNELSSSNATSNIDKFLGH